MTPSEPPSEPIYEAVSEELGYAPHESAEVVFAAFALPKPMPDLDDHIALRFTQDLGDPDDDEEGPQ
jgi:hypothetical protein